MAHDGCVKVAKLNVELGLTAASEASRYMDRPQRSEQAAVSLAGVWGAAPSEVQGQSPCPENFLKVGCSRRFLAIEK